jgi:hypothetical protein
VIYTTVIPNTYISKKTNQRLLTIRWTKKPDAMLSFFIDMHDGSALFRVSTLPIRTT